METSESHLRGLCNALNSSALWESCLCPSSSCKLPGFEVGEEEEGGTGAVQVMMLC